MSRSLDSRLRAAEREIMSGNFTRLFSYAIDYVRYNSSSIFPEIWILEIAKQVSDEFDRGVFNSDIITALGKITEKHPEGEEVRSKVSIILAQNSELRTLEQEQLAELRDGPTPELVEELAKASNAARLHWTKGETIEPVVYFVHENVVLGLPEDLWEGSRSSTILAHIMAERNEDPGLDVLGMLYDAHQSNEYLHTASWPVQPRGHARFVTQFGTFITASFHVIAEDKLLDYLISELSAIERVIDRYFNGIPWDDGSGLAPSTFSLIQKLPFTCVEQFDATVAEMDRISKAISDNRRKAPSGNHYLSSSDEERAFRDAIWNRASPAAKQLRKVDYLYLARIVWIAINRGDSNHQIRDRLRKILITRESV